MTADELGEIVSLSTSAVQRRLKRLRDEKIIEADVSIISPLAAGIGITCIVDVILEDGNSKALEKFKSTMRKSTEVMQCYFSPMQVFLKKKHAVVGVFSSPTTRIRFACL